MRNEANMEGCWVWRGTPNGQIPRLTSLVMAGMEGNMQVYSVNTVNKKG